MKLGSAVWAYIAPADLVRNHIKLSATLSASAHACDITSKLMLRLLSLTIFIRSLVAVAHQPIEFSADDFKVYRHFTQASEDPRVLKMNPASRRAAIAKDAKVKLKDLEKVIARAEAAGDFKAKCESNIREAIESSDKSVRLVKIDVDVSEPHAVAYVQWLNETPEKLAVEASVLAANTARACPILSTVQVWANDREQPKQRVFEALISAQAAQRIDAQKASEFAQTRYLRLFEKLKSIAHGDVFLNDASDATPQGGG